MARGYLYKLLTQVSVPSSGGVSALFWSEDGYIHFAHFGLEWRGMGFKETTGVYERVYRFNAKCARKKEKCEFVMDLICLPSNLTNDNNTSALTAGLKTGVKNCIFFV